METTRVIFRRWKRDGQSVIALFPRDAGTNSPHTCSSYEQIGQHGSADLTGVIDATIPASIDEPEVADLMRELEQSGYKLQLVHRQTSADYEARKNQIARIVFRDSFQPTF